MSSRRWAVVPALALSLLVPAAVSVNAASATGTDGSTPSTSARAGGPDRFEGRAVHRTRLLAQPRHGRAALRALGTHIAASAAVNHLSVDRLRDILRTDATAVIARDGTLYYADTLGPGVAQQAQLQAARAPAAAPFPLDQTFLLHSRPLSQRHHTIYLDFDGYTLPSNSFWVTQGGVSAGVVGGWSLDGDPAFSDTEKTWIQDVWQMVAEKYAAFDVDVTTEDPGTGGLNRTQASDPWYGDRVVFTDSATVPQQVCNNQCAGVAAIGTFNAINDGQGSNDGTDYSEPAWVFTQNTFDSPALSASDAAHEVGHTFGLEHDGTSSAEYYQGQGNWFPIMGAGINAVGQFSKGEYPGANNKQDDLAVIAANGAPLLPDDHGDTTATADPLGAADSYAVDGIIGTQSDLDVFKIDRTCSGALNASATGIGEGQAVDLSVDILDSNGTVLTHADPASGQDTSQGAPYLPTGLDASATVASADPGTYYVRVDGVGSTPFYTDYGSIGQYHLAIDGCTGSGGATPGATPGVSATPISHTSQGTVQWGDPAPGDNVTGWHITGMPGGALNIGTASQRSADLSGLTPGFDYTVTVSAVNQYGIGAPSTAVLHVPSWVQVGAPSISAVTGKGSIQLRWAPSSSNVGAASPLGWDLQIFQGSVLVSGDIQVTAGAYGLDFTSVPSGTYTAYLTQILDSDEGQGLSATAPRSFTVPRAPSAPHIGTASSGARGRPITAIARWTPGANGGAPITGFKVKAYQLSSTGRVVRTFTSTMRAASARSYNYRLPAGRYKFRVLAYNKVGASPLSAYSRIVTAR